MLNLVSKANAICFLGEIILRQNRYFFELYSAMVLPERSTT